MSNSCADVIPFLAPNRSHALRKLAKRFGYEFLGNTSLPQDWQRLRIFQHKRRRQRNLIRRIEDKRALYALDFGYQLRPAGQRHWQSAVISDVFAHDVPHFLLEPLAPEDQAPGLKSLPVSLQFSSHYLLSGRCADMLEAVFSNTLMPLFENTPGWTIEGVGRLVICYRPGELVASNSVLPLMREVSDLLVPLEASLAAWDRRDQLEPFGANDFDTVQFIVDADNDF